MAEIYLGGRLVGKDSSTEDQLHVRYGGTGHTDGAGLAAKSQGVSSVSRLRRDIRLTVS